MRNSLKIIFIFILHCQVILGNAESLSHFDYSKIINESNYIIGFISNGQRLYIHFDRITKNAENPSVYNIEGKSRTKQNICNFYGSLKIDSFVCTQDCGLVKSYILNARYKLHEDSTNIGSGVFSGKLTIPFFIYSDSVFGGSLCKNSNKPILFEGFWESNRTKVCKNTVWYAYRTANTDFWNFNSDGYDEENIIQSKIEHNIEQYEYIRNIYTNQNDEYDVISAEEQREWWKGDKEITITWNTKKEKDFLHVDLFRNSKYLQTIKLHSSIGGYCIEQKDYNSDGYRDISIFCPNDWRELLWSPNKGKYIEVEKCLSHFRKEFIFIYEDSNESADLVNIKMYRKKNCQYVLVSELIKRRNNAHNNLKVKYYDEKGKVTEYKDRPTYTELSKEWQEHEFNQYITDLANE
ncbi:MAG: hypothetical protein J6M59_00240 [Bacteroidaceae bacterium]|nr:hypothetical protein [Bacteroidaceae bacterium]